LRTLLLLLPEGGGSWCKVFFACAALGFCVPMALAFAWLFACAALFGCALTALAFPCFLIGLLASPLCGAALTFFAAAKKDKQRKRLAPPAKRVPRAVAVVVHLESVPSHIRRE
jgi:hypothetical protein